MGNLVAPSAIEKTEVSPGFLVDFITHQRVKATPEETEAVQVFARRLVEDFGYPKEVITTRPQFRVRPRPSQREYPRRKAQRPRVLMTKPRV